MTLISVIGKVLQIASDCDDGSPLVVTPLADDVDHRGYGASRLQHIKWHGVDGVG